MISANLIQGSEEWLEWRRNGVTATDLCVLMGTNQYKSVRQLYDEKHSEHTSFVSAAMKRGNDFEEEARSTACLYYETIFPPLCVEHSKHQNFRASLDGYGLISLPHGSDAEKKESWVPAVLEIKVPSFTNFQKGQRTSFAEMKHQYFPQIQWQMYCAGVEHGIFFFYCPENNDFYTEILHFDADFADLMAQEATSFWQKILFGPPPEGKYAFKNSPFLVSYADQWRRLQEAKKEIKEREQVLREAFLNESGGESFETDDIYFIKQEPRKSMDTAKMKELLESYGILEDAYTKKSTDPTYTIRIKKKQTE